jgi:hypothetical protein
MTMSSRDEHTPSGESFEEAITIHARSSAEGVPKEYAWLELRFGRRGKDWKLISQSLCLREERSYDVLHIRLADGSEKKFYFDITEFFGKF